MPPTATILPIRTAREKPITGSYGLPEDTRNAAFVAISFMQPCSTNRAAWPSGPAASSIAAPGAEKRLLVERLADQLQPERHALRDSPAGTAMPGSPAMFTVTVKMSLRYISSGSPDLLAERKGRPTAWSASGSHRPSRTPPRNRA